MSANVEQMWGKNAPRVTFGVTMCGALNVANVAVSRLAPLEGSSREAGEGWLL